MPNFFKIFKKIIFLLNNGFDRYLNKRKKHNFCILFNLRSILLSLPVRVRYDNNQYFFWDYNNKKLNRIASIVSHANLSYSRGLKYRAQDIGEIYLLNLIDFKPGDIVFDCGANVGDLKLWFENENIPINYFGFEPGPIEFKNLQKNVSPSKVFNIGLWNYNSQLEFYLSSKYGDSSFIRPVEFTKKVKIPAKRIEDFISENVKLLKLEAEGAEPEILYGAGDKLNLIEYISADLGFERGINKESTIGPVANYLLSKNFEIVSIYPRRTCVLFRNKNYLKKD